jgi:lipopolysaccharide transport system ATP-binding protein
VADSIISVESVGKRYRLGATTGGQLSEAIGNFLRAPLRLGRRPPPEILWALKDVSLEVGQGEVVGLIGPNGAGKSTLLKILSRITPPTEGRVTIRGRVASLLEVGTGFHPELSGRENVFLNGTLLGMRRLEVAEKYEEIVEFSGLARFMETPVKRYSSGMYVRLAFAVAAHLDPEILLVDEVLAVGDVEFQRKCLGKMQEVVGHGRTIIFVSHNLPAVRRLCPRSLLIESGRVAAAGPTDAVIAEYLKGSEPRQQGGVSTIAPSARRTGSGEARVTRVALLDEHGEPTDQLFLGQRFRIAVTLEVARELEEAVVEIGISAADGTRVLTAQNIDRDRPAFRLTPGRQEVSAVLEANLLPGTFTVDVGLHRIDSATVDFVERALDFSTLTVSEDGSEHYPWPSVRGFARPESEWTLEEVSPRAGPPPPRSRGAARASG